MSIKYSDDLKQAGVAPKLAESLARVQSEAFSNLIEDSLATKGDILLLKQELKQDILLLEQDIQQIRKEMYFLFIGTIWVLGSLMTFLRFF